MAAAFTSVVMSTPSGALQHNTYAFITCTARSDQDSWADLLWLVADVHIWRQYPFPFPQAFHSVPGGKKEVRFRWNALRISESRFTGRQHTHHAIIAPLSVQNSAGGQSSCAPVASAMTVKALRMYWLLATPPESTCSRWSLTIRTYSFLWFKGWGCCYSRFLLSTRKDLP